MKRLRRDERGMTLVEMIVSLLMISMTIVLVTSGFAVAGRTIRRGKAVKNYGQVAAAQAEQATVDEEGQDQLTVGGVPVNGTFYTATAGDNAQDSGVSFSLFIPNGFEQPTGGEK